MKHHTLHWFLLAAVLLALPLSAAEDKAEPAPLASSVSLLTVGQMTPALLAKTHAFASGHATIPLQAPGAANVPAKGNPRQFAAALSAACATNQTAVLALVSPSATQISVPELFSDLKVALVPVGKPLAEATAIADTDRDYHRVLKSVMYGIGRLVGLLPCPNFRCVMYRSADFEQLDNKGADFCPHCNRALLKHFPAPPAAPVAKPDFLK